MDSMNTWLTFGPFHLDLANESLWQGNERLPLKPKSFAVLRTLVEHPQQLVTKEALLNTHWGDVAVGDAVLKTCIGEIRQALGDAAGKPKFIETVHRRGYRFIVTPAPAPPTSGQPAAHLLVGRDSELTRLKGWWEKAQQATRQIVFVTGEPGIGKTCVVNAFLDQITTSGEAWIGRGHCIDQRGIGEAYLPILEALGHLCRQPSGKPLFECIRQHAPTWLIQLPGLGDPAEIQELLPSVIGATPVRMMRELADALEVSTKNTPLIFGFEDLHWLDTSSVELLSYLTHRSHPARLLILGTYRPADLILHAHPLKQLKQELSVHTQCQELALECLPARAVEEFLIRRWTDGTEPDGSLHKIAQAIHQRTEGNPLFMVNVVDHYTNHNLVKREGHLWMMKETTAQATIPTGLRQFLDLRVEQLDARDRQLLAVASVVGMTFTSATIAAALDTSTTEVDRHCHELADRQLFIRRNGMSEWPDRTVAACYEFQHTLYQEALYEHIPFTQRMELHRKIGGHLENFYKEHTATIAAELALHFERGQDADRASFYHHQAGENSLKRNAAHEAILHLTKAIALVNNLIPGHERTQRELILQSRLGLPLIHTQGFGSPEVERIFRRARELCEQMPGNPQLLDVHYGLFQFYIARSERDPAKQLADHLLNLARQTKDPIHHIIAHTTKGGLLLHGGDFISGKDLLEAGLSVLQPSHHAIMLTQYGTDLSSIARFFLAWLHSICGLPQNGLQLVLQALKTSRELKHSFMTAGTLMSVGLVYQVIGDATDALAAAEESVAISEKEGYPLWLASGLAQRGWAKGMHGDLEQGLADLTQGLAMLHQINFRAHLVAHWAAFVEVAVKAAQYEKGIQVIEEALEFTEETEERWFEAELLRLKGEVTLGLAKLNKTHAATDAVACFLKAITIARKQGAKMFELRAVMSLSRLWQQQGKGKQAHMKLKKVYDWFTEGLETPNLKEAKALLSTLK